MNPLPAVPSQPAEPESPLTPASAPTPPESATEVSSTPRHIFIGPDGLRAGWSLGIYVLLIGLFFSGFIFLVHKAFPQLAPAAHSGTAANPIHFASFFANEAAPFFLVLLATFIMSRFERRPLGVYGLGGAHPLRNFCVGLLWGVLFLSGLVGLLLQTHLLFFDRRLLSGAAILGFGIRWLLGFLFVGLLEEYLLRGYLQFTLTRGLAALFALTGSRHSRPLGFWAAALILSLLFGLGHTGNKGESPIGLLSAGLAGFVFCFALWRSGSLWWAVGFHTAWDWAQSFLYGVPDSGIFVQNRLFQTHSAGTPLLGGGLTGPEGSIFILPALALIAVVIFFTVRPPADAAPIQAPPEPSPPPSPLAI